MAPAELKMDVELPSRNVQLELGLEDDKWDKQGTKNSSESKAGKRWPTENMSESR